MRKIFVTATVALLVLSGCTNADKEEPTEETTGEKAATVDAPDSDDFNKQLTASPDLENLRQATISDVALVSEDELVVSFEMESDGCHGHVLDVAETDSEVTVTLQTGEQNGVDPASCVYGVYPYTATVTLAQPLGERAIVPAEVTEPVAIDDPIDMQQLLAEL